MFPLLVKNFVTWNATQVRMQWSKNRLDQSLLSNATKSIGMIIIIINFRQTQELTANLENLAFGILHLRKYGLSWL